MQTILQSISIFPITLLQGVDYSRFFFGSHLPLRRWNPSAQSHRYEPTVFTQFSDSDEHGMMPSTAAHSSTSVQKQTLYWYICCCCWCPSISTTFHYKVSACWDKWVRRWQCVIRTPKHIICSSGAIMDQPLVLLQPHDNKHDTSQRHWSSRSCDCLSSLHMQPFTYLCHSQKFPCPCCTSVGLLSCDP